MLGISVFAEWVSTSSINESLFDRFDALWVVPGSPYRELGKTLWAIRHARETNVPCIGTCGGFQHMVLEYARNVLGYEDAQHAEYDPCASTRFVSALACSLAGREMELHFDPSSRIAGIYGTLTAIEQYYCNFGVDPNKVNVLKSGPLRVSGSDSEGEVRVIELPRASFLHRNAVCAAEPVPTAVSTSVGHGISDLNPPSRSRQNLTKAGCDRVPPIGGGRYGGSEESLLGVSNQDSQ